MVMSALYDRMSRNAILWMAYSTEFIDAARARECGLVSQVVPAAQLDAEIERFCQVLLGRPRPAILGLKEYLRVAPILLFSELAVALVIPWFFALQEQALLLRGVDLANEARQPGGAL